MAIMFYKLLDILNRRGLSKKDLQTISGFSSATMAKISAHACISLVVVNKICASLNVQPGDIMEYVPDEDESPKE